MSSSTQTGPAPSGESIKLTGGIEIECLLVTYYQDMNPATPWYVNRYTQQAQMKIYEELRAPMRVECVDCKSTFDYCLPLRKPQAPPWVNSDGTFNDDADRGDEYEDDYTQWAVSTDESLGLAPSDYRELKGNRELYHVAPIEIKSRVMLLTDRFDAAISRSTPGHTHRITYHEEVEAVYARLDASFNNPQSESARDSRLVINGYTSTHVHIGSSFDGFPLDTVKNVMSIMVANEIQLDSIHAADRITGTDRLAQDLSWNDIIIGAWTSTIDDAYNMPWSTHLINSASEHNGGVPFIRKIPGRSEAVHYMPVYPALYFRQNPALKLAAQKCDVASWLILIQCAQSIHDMKRFQSGAAHSSTVNLANLKEQKSVAGATYNRWDGKMTIEFRQHGGTLQSEEILSWIGVLVSLLKYANTSRPADVKTSCLRNWHDPSFTMLGLLKQFGLRSQDRIFRHYTKVLGLVPQRRPYAELIQSEELAKAQKFGPEDRFLPLMKHVIRNRAETIHPDTVGDRIAHKFTRGGYGQFSDEYLSKSVPSEVPVPKYLKLGFCPPWSRFESQGDEAKEGKS